MQNAKVEPYIKVPTLSQKTRQGWGTRGNGLQSKSPNSARLLLHPLGVAYHLIQETYWRVHDGGIGFGCEGA